jgi:excinuclease ABC subunit C
LAFRTENIDQLLKSLPDNPGIYQYYNKEGLLIYVGKAKNLKKRVTSYFSKDIFENAKTRVLVKNITDIKFIITESEQDALLLENNLIKKHQPRYNVSLKDDKTYPWIIIKNEPFPRVFYTRKKIKDGSTYFGPYPSVRMIQALLDFIKSIYKLRNCNLNLTQENIERKKFKVCLEFHIKNCKGPCEALQTRSDYDASIADIREILKGNINAVINHFYDLMKNHAANYEFEEAQFVKSKIEILEKFKSKSVVVSPTITNVDVFTIVTENTTAFVNFMKVNNGSIIQAQTIELKKKLDETPEELIGLAIAELRTRFESDAKEVLVNIMPDVEFENVTFTIPKIGDKKHLLDMSEKNARYTMKEKLEQYDQLNPEHKTERLLNKMMHDLRMKELPKHIECFDNSNLQGTDAVAAMSVFKDAKPSKKDYRHFNIKTVVGPDDFASMEEVIYRRYKRMLDEKQILPQLIVIDGGKGQLSSAIKSLEKLNLRGKITIIGIAKKLEEIYFPGDAVPLYLDKKGETLKIIQHLRDEVHRFGITHHRNKRSKGLIKTELEQVKGIGKSTTDDLLREFKSVKRIKEATTEQVAAVIGNSKAKLLKEHFNKQ